MKFIEASDMGWDSESGSHKAANQQFRFVEPHVILADEALSRMKSALEVSMKDPIKGPIPVWKGSSGTLMIDLSDNNGERQFLINVVTQLNRMVEDPMAIRRVPEYLNWLLTAQ